MKDRVDRLAALMPIFDRWWFNEKEAARKSRENDWLELTAGLSLIALRSHTSELRQSWTKPTKPQPGDLFMLHTAHGRDASSAGGDDDFKRRQHSLDEVRAMARAYISRWVPHQGLDADSVRRHMRGQLANGVRMTGDAWREALREGVVTRDQVPFPTWSPDIERKAYYAIRDLGQAGYGWCDEQHRFVPHADAVDLVRVADAEGTPYPVGPTVEQIREPWQRLQDGDLAYIAKDAPAPKKSTTGMTNLGDPGESVEVPF